MEGATRVAIVGAGPAGCVMATALLDAARIRRRDLQVHLFGARSLWGPDRPLLLDEGSLAALTAQGIPLPPGRRLEGVLTIHGARTAARPETLRVLPRNRLVVLLRSLLHARGASLSERWVTGVARRPAGGFIVRADGASFPMDAVILACGAGATLGLALPDHAPPPAVRAVGAHFDEASLPQPFLRRHPQGEDELLLVPLRDGTASVLVGPSANAQRLGLRLLELGLRDPALAWGPPEKAFSFWLPTGSARPAFPCLGNALGGPATAAGLGAAFDQAERLAAVLLDEGFWEATAVSRETARALRPAQRREKRAAVRLRRFPVAARERALRAPRGLRGRLPSPAQRALAGETLGLWQAILAFFALLWAWVLSSLASRPTPANAQKRSREVFVVEDDPAQADGLCAFLRGRGFSCTPFPDALQAAGAAAKEAPAAVVLDLALPWVDGLDALRAYRRSWLRDTPVFVTSALPQAEMALRGKRPLAQAWLEKPLDLHELARRLDALLGSRRLPLRDDARQPDPADSDRLADDR